MGRLVTTTELIADLLSRGLQLRVVGDRLRCADPPPPFPRS